VAEKTRKTRFWNFSRDSRQTSCLPEFGQGERGWMNAPEREADTLPNRAKTEMHPGFSYKPKVSVVGAPKFPSCLLSNLHSFTHGI
jgi:hypothetical protein